MIQCAISFLALFILTMNIAKLKASYNVPHHILNSEWSQTLFEGHVFTNLTSLHTQASVSLKAVFLDR